MSEELFARGAKPKNSGNRRGGRSGRQAGPNGTRRRSASTMQRIMGAGRAAARRLAQQRRGGA